MLYSACDGGPRCIEPLIRDYVDGFSVGSDDKRLVHIRFEVIATLALVYAFE
jgi:hypothetical protein